MNLTDTLILPPDTVTRTLAILAQKGAGKTYAAMKVAELLHGAGQQLVCLDPTGVWWGLRSAGTGPGLDILIMGGAYGDVPLESTAGEIVAQFIVSTRRSVVLDLSHFESKAAQNRFVTTLAEKLYRLKAAPELRTPLHLMLDEADQFAPQRAQAGEQRMLGAFETIVRLGRSRGLGMTMISQRAAVVNKNVLTQVDALLCGRTTGKQDLDAVMAWVKHYLHTPEQAGQFLSSLPGLPVGEMWFWSPGWMMAMERGKVLPRTTHDSSSTPVHDPTKEPPAAALVPVDLSGLTEAIQASAAQAMESDPRELRKEIAALRTENARLLTQVSATLPPEKELVPFLDPIHLAEMRSLSNYLHEACAKLSGIPAEMLKPEPTTMAEFLRPRLMSSIKDHLDNIPVYTPVHRQPSTAHSSSTLSKCERAILTVLAQSGGHATKRKISVCSGYSLTSSGFANALSSLRTKGYMTGSDLLSVTANGSDALGDCTPLPTGKAAIHHWAERLPKCERAILAALLRDPSHRLLKSDLADLTGYSLTSSGFANALSSLRTRELIEGRDPIQLLIP